MVTHRLALAGAADHVAVLRGGRITEQGRPAELLRAGGQYARLCYSLPDPDRIGEGVRRLAAVVETEMQLRDDFGPMSAS